jgi:RNA polymerase sigma-70 factor (ECF subfamily)
MEPSAPPPQTPTRPQQDQIALAARGASAGAEAPGGGNSARGFTASEYDALYRSLWPAVVNYLRFRVGVADAMDVASDVFARGWAARNAYDRARGTPQAWIWAIARNLGTDQLRRPPPRTEMLEAGLAADGDLADERALADDVDRMLAAVARLGPEDREVIALRFGAGVAHREIGAMLGHEPGTVAVRLHRAIRKLRIALSEDQP